MVRRLKKRSWSRWVVLLVVTVLAVIQYGLARIQADDYAAPPGLSDGRYRIEKIVDPITFHARPLDGHPASHSFRVRLVGVQIPPEMVLKQPGIYRQLCQATVEFIDQNKAPERDRVPGNLGAIVELEFDRFHLADDQTAMAHLLVDGERLNIELAKQGLVLPHSITGNWPSVERKIRLASHAAEHQRLGMFRAQPPIEEKKTD